MICLVTDRRRLGAALGASPSAYLDVLARQIAAAAGAGIDLVQIREPDLDAGALTSFVRSMVERIGDYRTRVMVNDRVDVALAAGAGGVHLKESSFAPELVRRLARKNFIVSCAVHTPFTAAARSSADFLVAGTVLPTVSKSEADYLEWKGLREVVGAAKATPVLGIGGLDVGSIRSLVTVGAAGLAAVGAFIPESGQLGLEEYVKKRVIDMRFAFDSVVGDP